MNVSPKANNLQSHLIKGYAVEDNKYYQEIFVATTIANDYKNSYPVQKMGEAITLATRKALNTFGYFNEFEKLLDTIFEQGIPQYDKITT